LSGHVAESIFISGAHQRAVTTNPEPSVAMERTTYMDLNTTLQGSIGTSDMAPSPVNAGVTWSNAAVQGAMNTTDVGHVTQGSANSGISWNTGTVDTSHATSASANTGVTWSSRTMHGNMSPNHSEVRSAKANTGVTWSTLSGSTSPSAPQPKPKPYNSWVEALHANSNNMGWGASIHTNSNFRSGWGAPAPPPHAHLNPSSTTIPEPQKEVTTDPNASWGTTLALGNNTQSHWDTAGGGGVGGVDWASQWNRSSWHGGGSQSRQQPQPSRGQAYQRGICKFYESGYCKKGASCNYMHP
jgi:Zinc finger C-x8-C-x5-C-x3-H type (and similar)